MLRAQNFQTIDDAGIAPELRPHTLLPALAVQRELPDQLAGLDLGMDLEVDNFAHNFEDRPRHRLAHGRRSRDPLAVAGRGVYLEPRRAGATPRFASTTRCCPAPTIRRPAPRRS